MKYGEKLKKSLGVFALCVAVTLPAVALELSDAKSEGLVGETAAGYLAPVSAFDDKEGVNALVADINAKRKAHYQKIAVKNGIILEAVEARAGQKAIEKSSSGDYVNPGDGWRKKP